jgi:aconitase A
MMRGTFAHIRLQNQLSQKVGPYTTHFPSEVPTTVFEASQRYKEEKVPLFVVAGENFGRGAARDWATKGPLLLGVRAVLAVSFDPTYRANLVKTGIVPVQIDRDTYEILTGRERLDVVLPKNLGKKAEKESLPEKSSPCEPIPKSQNPGQRKLEVSLCLNEEFDLKARLRLDSSYEVSLFREGGVIKQLLKKSLRGTEKEVEEED